MDSTKEKKDIASGVERDQAIDALRTLTRQLVEEGRTRRANKQRQKVPPNDPGTAGH